MTPYYYDLHIHSCLSPCADNDMTPNNIAAMSALKGLQIIALTDHNSCKNCPAFLEACRANGIIAVAGMELSTAEDIHLVCLFEELDEDFCVKLHHGDDSCAVAHCHMYGDAKTEAMEERKNDNLTFITGIVNFVDIGNSP